MHQEAPNAVLVLADGAIFRGFGIGVPGTASGEVVFNTTQSGYQEVFTDPSYCGQIVAMTCPHIGNVGVNDRDNESIERPFLSGVVLRSLSNAPSSWRAQASLAQWLSAHNITGITGVDVRALARHIRERGAVPGVVSWPVSDGDLPGLLSKARSTPGMAGQDLASKVTCRHVWQYQPRPDEWLACRVSRRGLAVVMDFGVKRSILDRLFAEGLDIIVVPATTCAADILAHKPDLVVLSNGPGDPEALTYAIETVRELLGKLPIFGICLGHQILGIALGAKTYKLRFGHHGGNHPVKDLQSQRVLITAQNHGFAVDAKTLPSGAIQTFESLNDGTLEGFCLPALKVWAVQFHPEAAPGPHDAIFIFGLSLAQIASSGQSPLPDDFFL